MRGLRALRVRWLLMALGAALAVTACGGGDAGPSGPRATFEGLAQLNMECEITHAEEFGAAREFAAPGHERSRRAT